MRFDQSSASETSTELDAREAGTLWTMCRNHLTAHCVLFTWREGWELRVVVGAEILVTERCNRTDEAFALADRWKQRLMRQEWREIVPTTR
jgi:hypothetical protein